MHRFPACEQTARQPNVSRFSLLIQWLTLRPHEKSLGWPDPYGAVDKRGLLAEDPADSQRGLPLAKRRSGRSVRYFSFQVLREASSQDLLYSSSRSPGLLDGQSARAGTCSPARLPECLPVRVASRDRVLTSIRESYVTGPSPVRLLKSNATAGVLFASSQQWTTKIASALSGSKIVRAARPVAHRLPSARSRHHGGGAEQ